MEKRITDLNSVHISTITPNDVLPIINITTDETNKITIDQIKTYVNSGVTDTYQIGQYVEEEGGVIFYSYKENNTQFYYVVSTEDLSTGHTWSDVVNLQLGGSAQSPSDGYSNSLAITNQSGHTKSAAQLCFNYRGGGKNDWYLPAINEFGLIYNNVFILNKTLNNISGDIFGVQNTSNYINRGVNYWSSSEGPFFSAGVELDNYLRASKLLFREGLVADDYTSTTTTMYDTGLKADYIGEKMSSAIILQDNFNSFTIAYGSKKELCYVRPIRKFSI
jgi:hypothetical protein